MSTNTVIPCSIPCVIFGTADSLGKAAMSGMVGHGGRFIGVSAICESVGQCMVSLSVRGSVVYTLTCVSTWVGELVDDTSVRASAGCALV